MLCSRCGKRDAVYDVTEFADTRLPTFVCDECLGEVCQGSATCPTCGWTQEEYMRTGLMGCADCYRAFLPLTLRETLRLQGKLIHEGARPRRANYKLIARRERLKQQVEELLNARDYAAAKRLSEEIVRLNREIEGEE